MNIYVGNLSRNTTEAGLKAAFEQFGEVASVKMIKDRITGELRGFAFVTMANPESAENAIAQMNGKELDGFRLRVNEAREPEARPRFNNNRGSFGGSSNGSSTGTGFRRPAFGDNKNRSSFRSRDRF